MHVRMHDYFGQFKAIQDQAVGYSYTTVYNCPHAVIIAAELVTCSSLPCQSSVVLRVVLGRLPQPCTVHWLACHLQQSLRFLVFVQDALLLPILCVHVCKWCIHECGCMRCGAL